MDRAASDPLALIRNTSGAMLRAAAKLAERADACDDPLVAAELKRLAVRCSRRAETLLHARGRAGSLLDLIKPRPG